MSHRHRRATSFISYEIPEPVRIEAGSPGKPKPKPRPKPGPVTTMAVGEEAAQIELLVVVPRRGRSGR
jgi:hypothetical protein